LERWKRGLNKVQLATMTRKQEEGPRSPWEEEIEQEDDPGRPKRVTFRPNTFQPTLEDQTRKFIAMKRKGLTGAPRAFMTKAMALVPPNTTNSGAPLAGKDPVLWWRAMKHKHWREAWNKELETLWDMGAFTWEVAPPGANVISSKILWKTKRDEDNNVERHKARGVAMGNTQVEGETYWETFAPTVRMDTVRMFFKLAARKRWNMRQADVDAAFLIPLLPKDEVIYMKPFPTMVPPEGKENCVLRLRRPLYGIKQAPYHWNKEMSGFLEGEGYVQSSDPCLYLKKDVNGDVVSAVLFHVDDLLCTGEDKENDKFIRRLKEKYAIKDMGEPTLFLGIRVDKTPKGYTWCQDAYLERLAQKFNMHNTTRKRRTPIQTRLYHEQDGEAANAKTYRQLVGGLMYLMICTRPDICFAVNQLTRHFQAPQKHHLQAALNVLAYLLSSKTHGLAFEEEKGCQVQGIVAYKRGYKEEEEKEEEMKTRKLTAWSDADWAGDKEDRKSTTGYLLQLGNSVVSYRCQKQSLTATSSTVAELIALELATKEVLWQRKLFQEMFNESPGTVPIMEDNQGAKTLSDNNKFSHKTKHLPIKYFFCREKVKFKEISVDKVNTKDQLADIFTKPLGPQLFLPLREKLGVIDVRLK
jgi:hypothetical protein